MRRVGNYIDPSSAASYAAASSVQQEQAWGFLLGACPQMQGPVLDFGCGTGELTARVSNFFNADIMGLDISPDRIQYAQQRHANARVQFVQGDITAGVLSEDSYKTIVSFNAIHHVARAEMKTLFDAFYRLLKENGVAYLLVPTRSSELHDAIDEVSASVKWRRYFLGFKMNMARTYETAQYYQAVSKSAGFFSCRAKIVEQEGNLQTFDEFKKWLAGFLPQLVILKEKMPPSDYERCKADYLSEVVACYFAKRRVPTHQSVGVTVMQNALTLFKSPRAQFTYCEQRQQRSRLPRPLMARL